MKIIRILISGLLAFLIISCSTNPFTGRKQMTFLPESILLQMSLTNYQDFLSANKPVPKSDSNAKMVETVGKNIASSVEKFLKDNGSGDRIKEFDWVFNLVDETSPNAWCMPGGKVVVYSGILPYTKGEAGLATVLGHEIAHAVAKHGNERLSQQLLVTLGGMSLQYALKEKPEETKQLFMLAYGAGSTLGTLAYSRKHEAEADQMGMVFMAMAGYDPAKAIEFWETFAAAGGQEPPEFLSTHPSNATRIRKLKEFLPEAMKYYKK